MTQAASLPACCTQNGPQKGLWVVALGNDYRGDDAIGPMLIERLQTHFAHPDIDYSWHYVLNIEDALSLPCYSHVLFIDASVKQQQTFEIEALQADLTTNIGCHALTPAQLLHVFALHVENTEKSRPKVWQLKVSAREFELGSDLSPAAAQALEQTWVFLSQGLGAYCALMLLYRLFK